MIAILLLYYIIVKFKNKKTNPICPVKPSQLPLPPNTHTHTNSTHFFPPRKLNMHACHIDIICQKCDHKISLAVHFNHFMENFGQWTELRLSLWAILSYPQGAQSSPQRIRSSLWGSLSSQRWALSTPQGILSTCSLQWILMSTRAQGLYICVRTPGSILGYLS